MVTRLLSMTQAVSYCRSPHAGCVLIALATLTVSGCNYIATGDESPSKQPPMQSGVAPGSIEVEIIAIRTNDVFWRYQIEPSTGQVRRTADGVLESGSRRPSQLATGRVDCHRGSAAASPDGRFVASCSGDLSPPVDRFTVTAPDGTNIYTWHPATWRGIDGFAWSANSRSVALLNHSSRRGGGLWRVVGAAHPVPFQTVHLTVIDVTSAHAVEYTLRRDVADSISRIVNWSQ